VCVCVCRGGGGSESKRLVGGGVGGLDSSGALGSTSQRVWILQGVWNFF
jgi:hypothetical protein